MQGQAAERNPHGPPSRGGLGLLPSMYLKDASDGESEAGCSGDQEELGEAQTEGQNPAKEEASKNPQEQPCVLEAEDLL